MKITQEKIDEIRRELPYISSLNLYSPQYVLAWEQGYGPKNEHTLLQGSKKACYAFGRKTRKYYERELKATETCLEITFYHYPGCSVIEIEFYLAR